MVPDVSSPYINRPIKEKQLCTLRREYNVENKKYLMIYSSNNNPSLSITLVSWARPSCPFLHSGKKEGLGTLAVLPGSGGMQSMKNQCDPSRKEFNCRLMLQLNLKFFKSQLPPVVALA